MKNLHLIPTDKPSRLFYNKKDSIFTIDNDFEYVIKEDWFQDYNIYITSDEEIKEGDYRLNIQRGYFKKVDKEGLKYYNKKNNVFKKIILTTDVDLINDGIQAIDNEFLEWFVKNPTCEEVKIKKVFDEDWSETSGAFEISYCKIIIPKEEPKQELPQLGTKEFNDLASAYFGGKPKQETLEEAAERYAKQFDYAEDSSPQLDFIEGAKWQAERMYSEEEVLELWNWLNDGFIIRKSLPTREELIGWFEQFKKK